MEIQQEEQQLDDKNDNKSLSLGTDIKKTKLVSKKKVDKLKKKVDVKTLGKKKPKEVIEMNNFTENSGTTSFKRNLRPRRSSTMLDDYIIMTDSDEDDMNCETVIEEKKCEATKLSTKTLNIAGDSKSQKLKLSTDESVKKNLKINKTDLKPKKDLNKDSEVKKGVSETKSKNILLKHNKELEIKNNKTAAVDKKNEKSSKNKTEFVVITKEPKSTGNGSKNAGKKVPTSKQQSTKQENSNKKKSNLDLYNNNNNKKKRTTSSSSASSMFSGITSQTKEELLERMAANFDAKPTTCEKAEKPANKVTSTLVETINSAAVNKNAESNVKVNNVDSNMTEKIFLSGNIVVEKKSGHEVNTVNNKLMKKELEKVTETVAVPKVENNTVTTEKVENVVMVVNKLEEPECNSIVVPLNKVEKVENMVFQTIAKDLFLGQQKEIKITIPEYLSGKNFQLDNRFKQDDGLSVLSEICSALPRFNEPFVSSRQLLNKMPAPGDSSFVKYVPPVIIEDEKKDEKPLIPMLAPPSFDSRTVKIVNLARGSGNSSGTPNKTDLTASWKQAFKNVKLPKNGIASAAISISNNLIAWTKKKQNDNQASPPMTNADSIDGCFSGAAKKKVVDSDSMKTTPLQSSLVNGTENKSELSYMCQKNCCGESKTTDMDGKKIVSATATTNASYLAKTTILNSTKYDLKFEKRSSSATVATTAASISIEKQQQIRKDLVSDVSSSDDQSPEKKIFHQRRLSTTQSCSGNSSDAFSPDNETSVYAFQPDLPVASTPFRRNKPQSPAKSRTVSPNTSIAVSL